MKSKKHSYKKTIVADAGPLIALGRIDHLPLLSKVVNTVIIPQAVLNECVIKDRPGTTAIHMAIKRNFIKIISDPTYLSASILSLPLGKGEAAAIYLASQHNFPLLIDEKLGREVAKKLAINVVGTAGILLLAKRQRLIKKVFPSLEALKECGYYFSEELVNEILKLAKEK